MIISSIYWRGGGGGPDFFFIFFFFVGGGGGGGRASRIFFVIVFLTIGMHSPAKTIQKWYPYTANWKKVENMNKNSHLCLKVIEPARTFYFNFFWPWEWILQWKLFKNDIYKQPIKKSGKYEQKCILVPKSAWARAHFLVLIVGFFDHGNEFRQQKLFKNYTNQ